MIQLEAKKIVLIILLVLVGKTIVCMLQWSSDKMFSHKSIKKAVNNLLKFAPRPAN